MRKICVVEDESSLSEMIRLNLELEGYHVTVFSTGTKAQECFSGPISFDLIILDVMLPGHSGVDLCKQIRQKSQIPILFLSAKGTTSDRIEGLKAGGNDYLPKPFDLEELLLRVGVLILPGLDESEIIEANIGGFSVNFKTFEVVRQSTKESHSLSKKEVALIQLFITKNGEVISRAEILDKVWGKDQFPTTRTIDNYILNFRKIFEKDTKHPEYFHSIRGVGYKFTN
ncbi:MAG: response regulator transcription factor [Crocinitomicaceae bacterium]|jgi:two-component system alkaline phosphatase synthesis response regulator PhoP